MSEERLRTRLERLADTIDSYCDHEDDPGCLDSLHALSQTVRNEAAALAASGATLDAPATFPLDLDAFAAGLDSPNHSPESRKAWVRLFFRDMQRAARLSVTDKAAPATGCPDPEHPGGAYCSGTTGLHTCYPPEVRRAIEATLEGGTG